MLCEVDELSLKYYLHQTWIPYRDHLDGFIVDGLRAVLMGAFCSAGISDYKLLKERFGITLGFRCAADQKFYYHTLGRSVLQFTPEEILDEHGTTLRLRPQIAAGP